MIYSIKTINIVRYALNREPKPEHREISVNVFIRAMV